MTEKEACFNAGMIADRFGYGNVISRLQARWAVTLMLQSNLDLRAACLSAGIDINNYPIFDTSKSDQEIASAMMEYACML